MTKNKKILTPLEDFHETVKDISIDKLIPNVIDNFIITIFEDHHTIVLPLNITGSQFKTWNRGRGGVFSKDVLKYSLKKPHGKYILIKSKSLNCIARVISEEEEFQFKTMKLIDGQIKDRTYMIVKKIENEEKLTNTQRYINENDIEHEDNIYVSTLPVTSQDDDVDHHVGSISLFTE